MKKVLIVYYSRTGNTEKMAEYIAEGVRITGNEAELKKVSEIKTKKDLAGYNGYIFGCPTYHRTMPANFETFLFLAQTAALKGKIGGAFGSYTHSGDAPKIIFDTMEFVFKMKVTELGSFNMLEDVVGTRKGIKSCHDYGKAIGEKLAG